MARNENMTWHCFILRQLMKRNSEKHISMIGAFSLLEAKLGDFTPKYLWRNNLLLGSIFGIQSLSAEKVGSFRHIQSKFLLSKRLSSGHIFAIVPCPFPRVCFLIDVCLQQPLCYIIFLVRKYYACKVFVLHHDQAANISHVLENIKKKFFWKSS